MKQRHVHILLGTMAIWLSVSEPAGAQVASYTYMRFARHSNVSSVSNSTLNAAFSDATNALITDNGSNDELCWLTLGLHDSWWFQGGGSTDVVDNQTEYEDTQFNASDAYLNAVNELNWCDGIGAWGGCGWPIGGRSPILVTRALAVSPQGGILFAHEFGHTVGLNHDNTGLQIMDPDVLTVNDRKVKNWAACSAFRTAFPSGCKNDTTGDDRCICSIVLPGFSAATSSEHTTEAKGQEAMLESHAGTGYANIPIEELALSFVVDQMPVDVEDFYGQQDVNVLVDMLQDPANGEYARTIVTLIGLISYGTDEDVVSIAEYSEAPDAAFSAAMMALGTIASRTANELAFTILAEQLYSGDPSRDRAAALGLGLSGDARALKMLNDRATSERNVNRKRTFLQAAKENGRVAQGGLRQYYLQSHGSAPQRNRTLGGGEAGKEKE